MTDWKEIAREFDPELIAATDDAPIKRMAEEITRLREQLVRSEELAGNEYAIVCHFKAQLDESDKERQEQARLLGMSAERELALQAHLAQSRAENAKHLAEMSAASKHLDAIEYELNSSVYTLTDKEFETVFNVRDGLGIACRRHYPDALDAIRGAIEALKFYAVGDHFEYGGNDDFAPENPSGEPSNWECGGADGSEFTFENGSIARDALAALAKWFGEVDRHRDRGSHPPGETI
jgi:hypothetical protein